MRYIQEVCDILSREAEKRYVEARDNLSGLSDDFVDDSDLSAEQINALEAAKKEYLRAAKEYLAIAFKSKFLED
jgi:phage host-nuclease inhibitor protein Gam